MNRFNCIWICSSLCTLPVARNRRDIANRCSVEIQSLIFVFIRLIFGDILRSKSKNVDLSTRIQFLMSQGSSVTSSLKRVEPIPREFLRSNHGFVQQRRLRFLLFLFLLNAVNATINPVNSKSIAGDLKLALKNVYFMSCIHFIRVNLIGNFITMQWNFKNFIAPILWLMQENLHRVNPA